MADPDVEYLGKVTVPIVTFVAGFLVSRFTQTKAQRREDEDRKFGRAQELQHAHEAKFQRFCEALQAYIAAQDPGLDEFHLVATTGQSYLDQMKLISDAILSENVPAGGRDGTLVRLVLECADRTLPQYYGALRDIAERNTFAYSGELRRENYESIYAVVAKYGELQAIQSGASGS